MTLGALDLVCLPALCEEQQVNETLLKVLFKSTEREQLEPSCNAEQAGGETEAENDPSSLLL